MRSVYPVSETRARGRLHAWYEVGVQNPRPICVNLDKRTKGLWIVDAGVAGECSNIDASDGNEMKEEECAGHPMAAFMFDCVEVESAELNVIGRDVGQGSTLASVMQGYRV